MTIEHTSSTSYRMTTTSNLPQDLSLSHRRLLPSSGFHHSSLIKFPPMHFLSHPLTLVSSPHGHLQPVDYTHHAVLGLGNEYARKLEQPLNTFEPFPAKIQANEHLGAKNHVFEEVQYKDKQISAPYRVSNFSVEERLLGLGKSWEENICSVRDSRKGSEVSFREENVCPETSSSKQYLNFSVENRFLPIIDSETSESSVNSLSRTFIEDRSDKKSRSKRKLAISSHDKPSRIWKHSEKLEVEIDITEDENQGEQEISSTSACCRNRSRSEDIDIIACDSSNESPRGSTSSVPDYCQTISVRDSHGQVRQLVFPKALDLDRPKRARTTFSDSQLAQLEQEFLQNQYLVGRERSELADSLGLSEAQVKVWFQNRRTKYKREREKDAQLSQTQAESIAACNILRLLEERPQNTWGDERPQSTWGRMGVVKPRAVVPPQPHLKNSTETRAVVGASVLQGLVHSGGSQGLGDSCVSSGIPRDLIAQQPSTSGVLTRAYFTNGLIV